MSSAGATPLFDIVEPQRVTHGFLLNSPHSGDDYPDAFLALASLDEHMLRRSADLYVDRLFLGSVADGVPLMRAHFPRTYVDLNREPFELDPRLFEGRLPAFANTRSLRVAGGLGTIARVGSDAREIYARRLPVREGIARIDRCYHPYHAALRRRLADIRARFGFAVLLDCHSMPSTSAIEGGRRVDVVLGDRYGTSCSAALTDLAEDAVLRAGLTCRRNHPYAGGYITEHYGSPTRGMHALQIEVSRGLYMDEQSLAPRADFDVCAALMRAIIGATLAFAPDSLIPLPAAAE